MRWFIIFLLIANVAFFFWVQQDSRKLETAKLPPPDIGQLQLVDKAELSLLGQDEPAPTIAQAEPPESPVSTPEPVEPIQTQAHQAETDQIPEDVNPVAIEPAPEVVAAPDAPGPEPSSAVEPEASPPTEPAEVPAEVAVLESEVDESVPQPLPVAEMSTDQVTEVIEQAANETTLPEPEEPPPVEQTEPVAACFKVGPFKAEDADKLIAELSSSIELLSDTTEPTQTLVGYYVLIPPLGSIAEGNKKLEELKQAGITDTWLFRRGEYQFAISLGLFSRESSAMRHAASVGKKGFDAEVRERTALRDRRWLQLKDSDGGELALPLPEGVKAESQSCP